MQLVHVIKPTGTRFEFTFPADTTPERIVASLDSIKDLFGYNGTTKKVDPNGPPGPGPVDFADRASGLAFDHPDCVVAILKSTDSADGKSAVAVLDAKKQPVELKRIKGPPAEVTPDVPVAPEPVTPA